MANKTSQIGLISLSCIIALILWPLSLWSQSDPIPTPSISIQKYNMDVWTIDDGLRTNTINHVMQSKKGFIWMSTYSGLIRFDGSKFETFDKKKIDGLEIHSFYKMYEDRDSTLLVITQKNGILQYKEGVFKPYEFNKNLPSSLRCLLLATDGTTWIGSAENGVFYVKEGQLHKINHRVLDGITILDIAEDKDGSVYFGTAGKGVIVFDGENFSQYGKKEGLFGDVVTSLGLGANNEMLVGTFQGINVIKNQEVSKFPVHISAKTNDIFTDSSKNTWLATDNGLFRVNYQTKEVESFNEILGFPSTEMNAIVEGFEGSFWLATEKEGLARLKKGKFSNYTRRDGFSSDRINIISQRNKDEFWVGCDNGSIEIINKRLASVRQLEVKDTSFSSSIRDIYFDSKGNAWIGSYSGLLKITGTKQHHITTNNGLYSNLVRRIVEDKKGNIWIGARAGGVLKITPKGDTLVYNKGNGLLTNYILCLLEMKDGSMLVGTNGRGVAKISPDGTIQNFQLNDVADGVLFFNLRRDNSGRIWAATNLGLMLFENEHFKKIAIDQSLQTDSFFDVMDDNVGGFWLTSNLGLVQIKSNELNIFLNDEIDKVDYKLYSNDDGMVSRECTGATRSLISTGGDIWVPTLGGVVVVEPGNIEENKKIPPVHITYFSADDEEFDIRKPIVVPPGYLRYKIDYTALSYLSPGNVRFKYRLEPVDKDWITGQTAREVQYTNLSPGDYTFKVLGSNNDDIWNEHGATIQFTVKPFFYETIWFYILAGLLVLGIFSLIYFWRVKRINKHNKLLKKLNSELDSFVYSTSHDLRAPLASILGLINVTKLETDPTLKDKYITMMESSVKKLDNFIQDIIDYSRNARMPIENEAFDIRLLINDVFEDLKFLEQNVEIAKTIDIKGEGKLNSDKRRLKIILNNLIANAIKYCNSERKSFIDVRVVNLNGSLKVELEDNGIGINIDHMDHIFDMFYRATESSSGSGIGLYIVKETIDKLGGKINVKSELGKGTKFTIEIPA